MTIITKAALAAELGVTKGRVSQYVKAGMPVRDDGKLDRDAVLSWAKLNRSTFRTGDKGAARAAKLAPASQPAPLAAKPALRAQPPTGSVLPVGDLDLEGERTRKLRLENDENERLLIRMDDALAALDAIVGAVPADLAAVPARVTDDLSIRRKIEDEIDNALNGLSRRFRKAAADLRSGRDALAPDEPDEPDDVGGEE